MSWFWFVGVVASAAFLGGFVREAWSDPDVRRWFLWTFRCLRGRRCAEAVLSKAEGPELPPGTVFVIEYECGGCGTHYRGTAIVGGSGVTDTIRERVR